MPTGTRRRTTALRLLNEQTIAANCTLYAAKQLIATVVDRLALRAPEPQTVADVLEALRASMHAEVDRLIDETIGAHGKRRPA